MICAEFQAAAASRDRALQELHHQLDEAWQEAVEGAASGPAWSFATVMAGRRDANVVATDSGAAPGICVFQCGFGGSDGATAPVNSVGPGDHLAFLMPIGPLHRRPVRAWPAKKKSPEARRSPKYLFLFTSTSSSGERTCHIIFVSSRFTSTSSSGECTCHIPFISSREKARAAFTSRNNDEAANEDLQMRAIARPELTRPEQVAAEYSDGLGVDECLPDLCFASGSNEISSQCTNISGRVVSVVHFIKAIQDFNNHHCASPHGGCFELQAERRVGFWSEYTFKCSGCGENKKVTTGPREEPTSLTEKTALGGNDAAVWGFMSIGSGHSHLEEAISVMEIPAMSKGSFQRREESIGKEISARMAVPQASQLLWMVPGLTEVHGHRYSANSGLAVIIGKRTQKLLYLGVRNKLCSTCEYYEKKGQTKDHACYENWDQSSGAMEADILVKGFQRSTEMHGVQYRTFIDDGDSSVHYQLQTKAE
ncbi:hypothetical protein HPB49_007025 [Dermacentor silvarum]|uniref:Uncharacterized protein n=1 Tax=Dermacentor silvarum TaxID=543639 RepID=A0ACB8CVV6_DERSI|nr:hypothetical protein HPB49_007025 [Dermacentor silvarum]